MSNDQVVTFGAVRRASGRRTAGLGFVWLCTIAFLSIGLSGRITSLVIAGAGLSLTDGATPLPLPERLGFAHGD